MVIRQILYLSVFTIVFSVPGLALDVGGYCSDDEPKTTEKTIDFEERVEATGISFKDYGEARKNCEKNLVGESGGLPFEVGLEVHCADKNPDQNSCTFKSASGQVVKNPNGVNVIIPGRIYKKQGRYIAECSANVKGSCVFTCTTGCELEDPLLY